MDEGLGKTTEAGDGAEALRKLAHYDQWAAEYEKKRRRNWMIGIGVAAIAAYFLFMRRR